MAAFIFHDTNSIFIQILRCGIRFANEEINFAQNESNDNWMKHFGLVHSGIINAILKTMKSPLAVYLKV